MPGPMPADPERPEAHDGREDRSDLHHDLRGPDFDGMRRIAGPDFVLRVPHLGIEVRGVDAAISWLQRTNLRLALRPSTMASLGPYTVYVDDDLDGDVGAVGPQGPVDPDAVTDRPSCHVLELDGEHLVSWCLVASTIERRLDRLPPPAGTIWR